MPDLRPLRDDLQRRRAQAAHLLHVAALEGSVTSPDLRQNRAAQAELLEQFISSTTDERLGLLDHAVPLVLFPVRLETRFQPAGPVASVEELLLRVYPDDVHVDGHEPLLTEAEWDAGRAYWNRVGEDATSAEVERRAWEWLSGQLGPARARWVARQTEGEDADPGLRPSGWSRGARTSALPDQWIAALEWADASGTPTPQQEVVPFPHPVPDPLPVGPSALDAGEGVLGEDALEALWNDASPSTLVPGMRWMLDFEQAVLAGMAVRIDLRSRPALLQHVRSGGALRRVLVYGVKATQKSGEAAARLQSLFEAHGFTGGLGFPLQGTPTNNSDGTPAGYRPGAPSSPAARSDTSPPPLPEDSNASVVAHAFGFAVGAGSAPDVFVAAPHAAAREQHDAAQMNAALWEPTWGRYIERLLAVEDPEARREVRLHFRDYVRGRGPLPILRVRSQPYGLLPVLPLGDWRAADEHEHALHGRIVDILNKLWPVWLSSALGEEQPGYQSTTGARPLDPNFTGAPRAGREVSRDPYADFLEVLGMDAHAVSAHGRLLVHRALLPELIQGAFAQPAGGVDRLLTALGAQDGPLAWTLFAPNGTFPVVPPAPLVRYATGADPLPDPNLTEQDLVPEGGLTYDALIKLVKLEGVPRVARVGPMRYPMRLYREYPVVRVNTSVPDDPQWVESPPNPLLFSLLRQGTFVAFARLAVDGLRQVGALEDEQRTPVLSAPVFDPTTHTFPLVERCIEAVLEGKRERLVMPLREEDRGLFSEEALEEVDAFWEGLQHLIKVGKNEVPRLELLLREALGLASYRLDAWITSYATRRLRTLREHRPRGLHLGGYGWVENLKPSGGKLDSDGFIHAPSVNHATTAAVLRSGYLAHRDEATGEHPLALDLSSERVQAALKLLEGVRAGQPLGALLGYMFERGLHESHGDLAPLILAARKVAPLVAGKLASDERDDEDRVAAHETVAPTQVVDGLTLLRRYQEDAGGLIGDIKSEASSSLSSAAEAVGQELEALANAVDAVSDLCMAESVHQMALGNPARTGASLDAIARGEAPPPEFDIVRTPRTGRALTHRVVVLGAAPTPPSTFGTDVAGLRWARADAAPFLNEWVGKLLGDLSRVRCRAELLLAEGPALWGGFVSLADLTLSPIDLLYLGATAEQAQQGELEQRVAQHVLRQHTPVGHDPATLRVQLVFGEEALVGSGAPSGTVGFAAFLEVVQAVRAVVTGARPLQARDLILPEDLPLTEATPSLGQDDAELKARADRAACQFGHAVQALRTAFGAPLTEADLNTLGVAPAELQAPPALEELPAVCGTLTASPPSLLDLPPTHDVAAAAAALDRPALQDLEGVRESILTLSHFGVQGAVPRSLVGATEADHAALIEQAHSLMQELRERVSSIALSILEEANPDPAKQLRTVFGRGFMVLPRFQPRNAEALGRTFGRSLALQHEVPHASATWLQRMAHVRERTAQMTQALLYAEAITEAVHLRCEVGQLPHADDATWAALPPVQEQPAQLSLVAHFPDPEAVSRIGGAALTGLLVDEWVETLPNSSETTAVTFQYDAPGARPPNTILLAVSPALDRQWTEDLLQEVIDGTLDLAKIRAVDPDTLQGVGHLLPAMYF